MKHTRIFPLLMIFTSLFFQNCTEKKSTSQVKEENKEQLPALNVPKFNSDSAYQLVKEQVSFGPRVPNTAQHAKCKIWITDKLKSYGVQYIVQDATLDRFDGVKLKSSNIVASISPEAKKRILISAHWDTRFISDQDPTIKNKPFDAANDAASGAAILLELARILSKNPPDIGVDLAFWDAEDQGDSDHEDSYCLGSQYWAKNPHVANYTAICNINLDMVGAKNAIFPQEGYSLEIAGDWVTRIWDIANQAGYGQYFSYQQSFQDGSGNSYPFATIDDHVYVYKYRSIPAVDIIHRNPINGNFFEYWHTQKDNLECIDPQTLGAVGQTMLEVIFRQKRDI